MSMLFYCDTKNNIVLHPDVVKLSPELGLLKDDEVLFIILAYDYNSIYRQFPERQRISKAIFHTWGDNKPELQSEDKMPKRMVSAIREYKSLQYNRNIELIELYSRKIDEQMEILDADKSTNGIKTASENIDRFKKLIKSIESEVIEEKLMEGQLKGKTELGHLEKLKANQKMFKAVTSKRT